MGDKYNIIPVTLAGLFHVLIFGGLVVGIDFSKPAYPAVPLAIRATLVTEIETPPVPEVKPEPAPVEEVIPEPPRENAEEIRRREEEARRQVDMREEQERIRLQDEADRERRAKDEAERKRLREEEVERRRQEAERKRLEDLERQRLENLRLRREAEAAEVARKQQADMAAEVQRLERMDADDTTRWVFALQQQIARNFVLPASAPKNLECVVDIRQLPGGQVVKVEVGRCNGDESVRRAIEAAVHKASPLPSPDNPAVFDRDLQITFKPEQ